MIKASEDMTITMDANRTGSANMFTVLHFLNDIWGVAVCVAMVALLLISGQAEDWRGEYQK